MLLRWGRNERRFDVQDLKIENEGRTHGLVEGQVTNLVKDMYRRIIRV